MKNEESRMSAFCMMCLAQKELQKLTPEIPDAIKAAYMRDVLKIIGESAPQEATPVVLNKIHKKYAEYYGEPFDYGPLKKKFNELMMQSEERLREHIQQVADPIALAMQLARVGNYIDFGTVDTVEPETLWAMLDKADGDILDPLEYAQFIKEAEEAQSLVYLTDNCGEILLDKLLIETMHKRWPNLKITVIVRGAPVLNDATIEDAQMVGMTEVVQVLDNGNEIAGTWIPKMSAESREKLEKADLIISKGQANFESLHGCGLNIYYLFLCKCEWFVRRFGMEKYKGVLANEGRLHLNQV